MGFGELADRPGPARPPRPIRAGRGARGFAGAAVAALAVATLAGGCSGTTQQSVTVTPAALVAESAHTTLDQKTADITVTGSVTVLGHTLTIGGGGAADFTSHLMSLNMSMNVQGQKIDIKELLVDGQLYLSGNFGGHSFADLTGKDWVTLPVPDSASNLFGSDPIAQLKLLEQQGAAVTPLGQKTLGGRTVTGYSIVPSEASIQKQASDEISKMGLSQSQASQIQNALQSTSPPTITVWFDASHLLRQTSVNLNLGSTLSGGSAGFEMDVNHYGVPVSITAPSPSDTVTYQQFLQDTQNATSSGA